MFEEANVDITTRRHSISLDAWKGSFGDRYTKRNRTDWRDCVPFFESVFGRWAGMEVLEVGCNAGHNLLALQSLGAYVRGVEPNHRARTLAEDRGLYVVDGRAEELPFEDESVDFAFTAGVLIHIHPEQLAGVLRELHRVSRKYILAVEYPALAERPIPYREGVGCWARPYGEEYLGRFPLCLLSTGIAPFPYEGCDWWLLEKQSPSSKPV